MPVWLELADALLVPVDVAALEPVELELGVPVWLELDDALPVPVDVGIPELLGDGLADDEVDSVSGCPIASPNSTYTRHGHTVIRTMEI